MDLIHAHVLARDLMEQHGIAHWHIRFDNSPRRAGYCNYTKTTIGLSRPIIELNSVEETRDTILHEIAHALAGPGTQHGPKWKEICVRIGARPVRCGGDELTLPKGRLKANCPNCGKEFRRHRAPRRRRCCRKCGLLGLLEYKVAEPPESAVIGLDKLMG